MLFLHVIIFVTSARFEQWLVSSSSFSWIWFWEILYWAFFSEMTFTTRKLRMIKTCESECDDSSFMIFLFLSNSVLDFFNVFDWVFSMMITWLSMMRLRVIMWFRDFVSWFDEFIVIMSSDIDVIIFISNSSFSEVMLFRIVVTIISFTEISSIELKFIRFFFDISFDQMIIFFSIKIRFNVNIYFHVLRFEIHFVIFARYFATIDVFFFDDDCEDFLLSFLFVERFRILFVNTHRLL
jgi:hypothetical protein